MYGEGTEAGLSSQCSQCHAPIEFDFVVTAEGGRSNSPAAAALREWDPVMNDADRREPHILDGF